MHSPRYLFRKGVTGGLFKRRLDGRNALLHVQLPRFSIGQSVIVVDTICNITALLGLQNQSPALNGMDTSRIDLEEVAFLHRDLADKFVPLMAADHGLHLLMAPRMVADDNLRPRVTVQNIPALCLPQRSVLMNLRILVIRMDLNA